MLFGGFPAALMYIALACLSVNRVIRKNDKFATALYASVVVLSLMSLMEIYNIQITFFIIVLTYYYGIAETNFAPKQQDEQQKQNHSQHLSAECT